ncbi:hypothetical protein Vadar_000164 [Vaccinium darrowii]|uniref:Uncharacterized protein n=1 Tax=Vaccinium darrowii TaxID=229202 RepID=A0ACB7ZHK1_9ERIC|nr:hypothetical protein Vadar_000164 [Vaccinium darrowii]
MIWVWKMEFMIWMLWSPATRKIVMLKIESPLGKDVEEKLHDLELRDEVHEVLDVDQVAKPFGPTAIEVEEANPREAMHEKESFHQESHQEPQNQQIQKLRRSLKLEERRQPRVGTILTSLHYGLVNIFAGETRVTLHVKFGGKFSGNPKKYSDDPDVAISRVIPCLFTYKNMLSIFGQFGCRQGSTYFYLKPGHGIDDGPVELGSDVDIKQMLDLHEGNDNDIKVYQTHPANEFDEEEELMWGTEVLRGEREQCVVSDTSGYDSDTDSDYRCSGLRDSFSSDESLVEEVNSECVVPQKEPSGNSDFMAEGGTSAQAVEEVGEGTSAKAVEVIGEETSANVVEEVGEDAILGDDEENGNSIDSSDDNESVVDSSDDEKGKKKVKHPEFNEERDIRETKLYIKNESKRVTAKCSELAEVGCMFRLHASRVDNTSNFQIKTITGEHTCGRKYQSRWASTEWLAKKYLDNLIDDPDWKVTAMQNDVKRAWMLDVPQSQIYRAKKKAELIVEGDYGEQYFRLWDYCDLIRRENPGSCAKLLVDRTLVDDVPYFQRIFVMFDAQVKGFVGNCRPIGLGKTWLPY